VVSAYAGEQQRPAAVQSGSAAAAEPTPEVKEGLLQRLMSAALQGGSAAAAESTPVKEGLLQRLIPAAVK